MNTAIKFKPWKGDCYCTGSNYRSNIKFDLPRGLMLLGESHYDVGHCPDATRKVVKCHIRGERVGNNSKFFQNLEKVLLGRKVERSDPKDLWQSVAFYNFVQYSLDSGARPKSCMWMKSKLPFRECLDYLRPTHIVACGFTLWDHLPDDEGFWIAAPQDEDKIRKSIPYPFDTERHRDRGWSGRYRHRGGECRIVKIKHPSRAFSWRKWHRLLRAFFQLRP